MLTLSTVVAIWITFIALLAVCVAASQNRGANSVRKMDQGGVRVSIGASIWVLLTAATLSLPWGYEALRWRHAEFEKSP